MWRRPIIYRALTAIILAALLLAALVLAGCGQGGSEAGQTPGGSGVAEAQTLERALRVRLTRVVVLCELGGKAAPTAPDLARSMYQQALEQASGLIDPDHRALAERLRAEAESGDGRAALAAAQDLEALCLPVWPLRLVAEGAQAVAPEVADKALHLALMNLGLNKDPLGRDQDLAGLALVIGRRDAAKARELARQVGDPGLRASLWRQLAGINNYPPDLQQAFQAGREVAEPAARALSLAATALAQMTFDPAVGRAWFAEAFAQAGQAAGKERRAWAQGEVAALLAQADPAQAFTLAQAVPGLGGARFKALRRVGLAYLGSDPERGSVVLAEAARQAERMLLPEEGHKALALVAQDLAVADPAQTRVLLASLPPGERLLRGEVKAALVLAEAGRNLSGALAQARRVDEPQMQALLLARLAAIELRADREKGLPLYQEALDLALEKGGDHARQNLAPAWAALEPSKGVDIAASIGENVARVKTFMAVAKVLAGRGEKAGAAWCLELAQKTLAEMGPQQTIDKVRLLGDMGREWAAVEARQSRRFFEMAVEAAGRMG